VRVLGVLNLPCCYGVTVRCLRCYLCLFGVADVAPLPVVTHCCGGDLLLMSTFVVVVDCCCVVTLLLTLFCVAVVVTFTFVTLLLFVTIYVVYV